MIPTWEIVDYQRDVDSGAILERVVDAIDRLERRLDRSPTVREVAREAGYYAWVILETATEAQELGLVWLDTDDAPTVLSSPLALC